MLKLNMLTVVGNDYTAHLASIMRKTFSLLKSDKFKVYWHVAFVRSYDTNLRGFNTVYKQTRKDEDGWGPSIIHAKAIDASVKKFKSPFVGVVDADTAMFYKNWDSFLIDQLNQNIIISGIEYPSDKSNCRKRYKKFPCVFFSLFKLHNFKKMKFSFMPGKDDGGSRFVKILSHENADKLGIRRKQRIYADTGWKLPIAVKSINCDGYYVPYQSHDPENTQLDFGNDENLQYFIDEMNGKYMNEYYINNKLFLCHLKQSRRIKSSEDKRAKVWEDTVSSTFKKLHGITL